MSQRFRVALSFPGEHRNFVAAVAEQLSAALGRERVLYDAYYEAESARPDLDVYLQRLYFDESELLVVFLSAEYEKKEWCGLEWRAIRDLIKKRKTDSVMPMRFDMTEIPGLFSIDGYVWLRNRTPAEVADLILKRIGWVSPPPPQRIAVSRLLRSANRLFGREARLAQLAAAWTERKIRVLTLVAWGGVGKTSLVAKFADTLAAQQFDGADYFDWSFYSQGSSDASNASADPFVDAALRFFGDVATADSKASAWDKGAQLAKLLATRRALLVLDGLEPLQHPPGPLAGNLKDPVIIALLRGLAQRNAGLCLVTTRERVADLERWEDGGAVQQWKLEHLSTAAGIQFLESLGVNGSAVEMAKAVDEVQGHSLALNLLGRYLKAMHRGDVRQRMMVSPDNGQLQGDHAFRTIAMYERWFERERGRQELDDDPNLLDHPLATGLAPEWATAWGEDGYGVFVVLRVGKAEQKLRYIPRGSFLMGSPETEQGRWEDEGPQHLVTLTEGYWLADTPCTQEFWQEVMGNNPSRFQSPKRPVEQVSWDDVQGFLRRLEEKFAGLAADLPTEAQWEHACRAGTTTSTYAGELKILGVNNAPLLDGIAWYGGNSGIGFELEDGYDSTDWLEKQYPHKKAGSREVGQKRPNAWGFYDMLGNVWEWCADLWGSYSAEGQKDPGGAEVGSNRVYRGGSWISDARNVRAACRNWYEPGIRGDDLGFRFSLGRPRSGQGAAR